MRNKIDNLLLGLLWILISTLGLCFWFNIQFGFNLLSSAHWKHLSYMQATRAPITPMFYISLVIGVFFIIFGLYLLIRPHFRKIKLATTVSTPSVPTPPIQPAPVQSNEFELSRPKRLGNINHTMASPVQTAPLTAPVAHASDTPSQTITTPEPDNTEITDIFESAGYIIKHPPRIKGYQPALLAIGNNETVWIGGIGIETSTMQSIIDLMQQVFSDTLEDIEITTHGFVINAADMASPGATNILTFENVDQLREFMSEHPNPPTDSDMAENFEAFSTYISTVIDYIGRL